MSILAPALTSVGLQVLLQPYSTFLGSASCTVAGVIYPAYASFKAVQVLRTRRGDYTVEAESWLTYWGVYATLSMVERLLDKALPWVPYYHTAKFVFLLWLQLPRYQGARRVYRELLLPLLAVAEPHVDDFLAAAKYSLRRPELVACGELANHYLAKAPVLEWFVRGPDGQRVETSVRSAFLTDGHLRTARGEDREEEEDHHRPGTPRARR